MELPLRSESGPKPSQPGSKADIPPSSPCPAPQLSQVSPLVEGSSSRPWMIMEQTASALASEGRGALWKPLRSGVWLLDPDSTLPSVGAYLSASPFLTPGFLILGFIHLTNIYRTHTTGQMVCRCQGYSHEPKKASDPMELTLDEMVSECSELDDFVGRRARRKERGHIVGLWNQFKASLCPKAVSHWVGKTGCPLWSNQRHNVPLRTSRPCMIWPLLSSLASLQANLSSTLQPDPFQPVLVWIPQKPALRVAIWVHVVDLGGDAEKW